MKFYFAKQHITLTLLCNNPCCLDQNCDLTIVAFLLLLLTYRVNRSSFFLSGLMQQVSLSTCRLHYIVSSFWDGLIFNSYICLFHSKLFSKPQVFIALQFQSASSCFTLSVPLGKRISIQNNCFRYLQFSWTWPILVAPEKRASQRKIESSSDAISNLCLQCFLISAYKMLCCAVLELFIGLALWVASVSVVSLPFCSVYPFC